MSKDLFLSMIQIKKITTIILFITVAVISVSCNRAIVKKSDIGMSMEEFFDQVGDYSVLEMGTNSGVFSFGDGRNMRVAHFKNGKLIKIRKK